MKFILSYIIFFVCLCVKAQPPKSFYFRFGGNGYDVGNDIKQTFDKGYIITGSTSSFGMGNTDLYLVKLDSMGQKVFDKTFGNYNNEVGKSIIQLSDSSIVMAGYTNSFGSGGYDIFVVKTNKNGNVIWQKTFGGTDWDFAHSIKATQDGGLIVAGTTYSYGRGNADGYLLKLDVNGNTQWQKTYGGVKDDEFKSVVETNDGGFALTGYTKSYNDVDSGDVWVFKTSNIGDSLWCKFYGGGKEDFGNEIIQLQNQKILVAGGTKSFSSSLNYETALIEYDLTNSNQTYHYIDVSTRDEFYSGLCQGLNGNIVGCGMTNSPIFKKDCLMDIYSITYSYVNFFSEGSDFDEEFFSVSPTIDKGFVAVGKTNGYGAILEDVFVLKVDSNGMKGNNLTGNKEIVNLSSKIKLFPNPVTNGKLNVNFAGNNNVVISISSIEGQELYKANFVIENTIDINLENFKTGLYLISIENLKEHQVFHSKIQVIEK